MSHTKGPWEVDSVLSEGLHDIVLGYQIPEVGNPITLAFVHFDEEEGPGRISLSEAEANARLIAAAPDLLEACQDALAAIPERSPIRPMILAAIAKATGGTP